MKMETMQMLEDNLCSDIDQYAKKKNLDRGEVAVLESLVNIVYKLGKMSDSEYSKDGMWTAHGSYANDGTMMSRNGRNYSYANEPSYGRDGMHYVRGHYSHSSYGNGMVADHIKEMMNDGRLNSSERETLQRAMEIMEK